MKTFLQFCEELADENDRREAQTNVFKDNVARLKKNERLKRIRAKLAAAGVKDDEGDFADESK
jgi:hypothetical protein